MASLKPALRPTVSLSSSIQAIQDISNLIEQIEESETDGSSESYLKLMESIVPKFDRSVSDFKSAVDRRIHLMEALPHVSAIAKANQDHFAKKIKASENLLAYIKESTKEMIKQNPDLDFQGSNKKLCIQKNSGLAPIQYNVELQILSTIIDPTQVELFPEEFTEKLTVYVLKKKEFDASVRTSGFESKAATLKEVGEHVRVR